MMTAEYDFKHSTREAWLFAAMPLLAELLTKAHTAPVDHRTMRVSVGWPRNMKKSFGECWAKENSEGGVAEIFISPALKDAMKILDVLLHEMVHGVVGHECKHKGPFKTLARAAGLEGKLTATFVTEGTPLWIELNRINNVLGTWPGIKMDPKLKPKKPREDPWISLWSVNDPDEKYRVRLAISQMEIHGRPKDPWGELMLTEDEIEAGLTPKDVEAELIAGDLVGDGEDTMPGADAGTAGDLLIPPVAEPGIMIAPVPEEQVARVDTSDAGGSLHG